MRIRHLLGVVFLVLLISALLPTTLIATAMYREAAQVTTKEYLVNITKTGIVLLDRHEQPFFSFYQGQTKTYLPLASIPPQIQQAVVAIEDQEFYQHRGFSTRAIARSIYANFQQKSFAYGGSTITQQLVKNSMLTPQKSLTRKYKEIILAAQVERRFSKDDILEMYLNTVYFGEGAFGIESAAQRYFGKSASELTLEEGSLLVGLLPSPSSLSPLGGTPQPAKARQSLVLRKMQEQGYITAEAQARAADAPLRFNETQKPSNVIAPHFALMVRDELLTMYDEAVLARSGFRVTTTLDLEWQKKAETMLLDHTIKLRSQRVSNGAVVALDPKTGAIRALAGSYDWHDPKFGQVNMAAIPRQPGSSFKPIVYAAALEQRVLTPATLLRDMPTTFGRDYRPNNYDNRFRGPVIARRALATSLNVPSVEVLTRVGINQAVTQARAMGVTTLQEKGVYDLALALGATEVPLLEMVEAYGTLAQAGQHHESKIILEIKDKFQQSIYQADSASKQALRPSVAFMVSSILADEASRKEVFGTALTLDRPAAAKTGTTENYRDAWTIGYTPSLVVGVWIGNNDNTTMHQVAGSLGAAPLWRELMTTFLQGTPPEEFSAPSNLLALNICRHNGLLLRTQSRGGYTEYFEPGTQPTRACSPRAPQITPEPSPTPPEIAHRKPSKPSPRPKKATDEDTELISEPDQT